MSLINLPLLMACHLQASRTLKNHNCNFLNESIHKEKPNFEKRGRHNITMKINTIQDIKLKNGQYK